MADTLYLSLWYPNLRLAALAGKLTAVLGAFAAHGGEALVYSATVWPVNWSESPVFQQVYGRRIGAGGDGSVELGVMPQSRSKMRWNCCTTTSPTSSRLAGACGSWRPAAGSTRAGCGSRGWCG